MRTIPILLFTLMLGCTCNTVNAQTGLKGIFVETYYVADENDAAADPGKGLKAGAVTYRIFAELKPGYKLLTVYGAPGQPLFIKTSTEFYNNSDRGQQTGTEFSTLHLPLHTTALDSYLAVAGASRRHYAVPKDLDDDGSIYERTPTDTTVTPHKVLFRNRDERIGAPLYQADGLIVAEAGVAHLRTFGDLPLAIFKNENRAEDFFTDNGAWAIAGGLKMPRGENFVMVAQITTDGILEFQLNLQIQSDKGVTEYHVAQNPKSGQFTHPTLVYSASTKTP